MTLSGEGIRQIHKKIYEMTKNQPKMTPMMYKIANKSVKTVDRRKNKDENSLILLILYAKQDYNGKIKKVINHEVTEHAEKQKDMVVTGYIAESRKLGKYIYIASSHNDCAADHVPYQGKLYYDAAAPNDIKTYCVSRGMMTVQDVMNGPAWFITRPNCRHFMKSLPTDIVKKYSMKELKRRYKMHRKTGDKSLATPKKIAIEEYEDRLHMLQAMYREHPTENLRRKIEKTKMLLKKWKNRL